MIELQVKQASREHLKTPTRLHSGTSQMTVPSHHCKNLKSHNFKLQYTVAFYILNCWTENRPTCQQANVIRFEVLTEFKIKISFFWNVTPYILIDGRLCSITSLKTKYRITEAG
jgi:hypothetical protein